MALGTKARFLRLALQLALAVAIAAAGCGPPPQTTASVHFMDVGQGDAILIQVVRGASVLIDGGPAGAGPGLAEYLARQGVTRLDCVVATHPHADHIGGLADVMRGLPVGRVMDAGVPGSGRVYEAYMDAVAESGASYSAERLNTTLDLGAGARLKVMYPAAEPPPGDPNAASVAALFSLGNVDVLFTGDLPSTYEMQVAEPAEVLKVGHHGSRTSTSSEFLAGVRPSCGVIQVGKNNYGHPAPETLERLAAAGVTVYRTDLQGTVVMHTDGTGFNFDRAP